MDNTEMKVTNEPLSYNDFTIRPSGKNMSKDMMGLYYILGINRAVEVYTGLYDDCDKKRDRLIKASENGEEFYFESGRKGKTYGITYRMPNQTGMFSGKEIKDGMTLDGLVNAIGVAIENGYHIDDITVTE